jgi:pimeloyl-ACP methyl ester carboxylesterase
VTRMHPDVRRGYCDGPFGQIHYRRAGGGSVRPLLCFHMSPHSGLVYEAFLREMGADRLTIAPDTPGFGESDPPDAAPGIADYARAMAALMDALALPEVDVIGYHTGSKIAVALALLRPAQVRHVVMISAPVFTTEERESFRDLYGPDRLDAEGSHLQERWAALMRWRGPGQTVEMAAEHFFEGLRRPDISWWGHYAAFAFELADLLPQLRQPALLLNPGDDLTEYTRRAAPLLANGRMLELPDWGHGLLQLRTAELGRLVREFCDAMD